jgi:hypothetical protein
MLKFLFCWLFCWLFVDYFVELLQVSSQAGDRLMESIMLDYILNLVSRQGNVWGESEYANKFMDGKLVIFLKYLNPQSRSWNNDWSMSLHTYNTDLASQILAFWCKNYLTLTTLNISHELASVAQSEHNHSSYEGKSSKLLIIQKANSADHNLSDHHSFYLNCFHCIFIYWVISYICCMFGLTMDLYSRIVKFPCNYWVKVTVAKYRFSSYWGQVF